MSKSRKGNFGGSIQNPFDDSALATQPATYEHDDTPKAFKRLMQFKAKMAQKPAPKPFSPVKPVSYPSTTKKIIATEEAAPVSRTAQSLIKFAEAGSKISEKRKAYLKKRDERKRAKKQNSAVERDFHSSRQIIKSVRDVVQEPPKALVKPKKVFKKEIQSAKDSDDESLPSGFSDFDAEDVDFSDLE